MCRYKKQSLLTLKNGMRWQCILRNEPSSKRTVREILRSSFLAIIHVKSALNLLLWHDLLNFFSAWSILYYSSILSLCFNVIFAKTSLKIYILHGSCFYVSSNFVHDIPLLNRRITILTFAFTAFPPRTSAQLNQIRAVVRLELCVFLGSGPKGVNFHTSVCL